MLSLDALSLLSLALSLSLRVSDSQSVLRLSPERKTFNERIHSQRRVLKTEDAEAAEAPRRTALLLGSHSFE